MFKTLRFKKGFTLVEVVVAAIIFALATAGIYATISALSRPAEETSREVTAAFLAKRTLDNFRTAVDGDTWTTGALTDGAHALPAANIDGINYQINYSVGTDAFGSKQVNVMVRW